MCHKHQEVHSQSTSAAQRAQDLCVACITQVLVFEYVYFQLSRENMFSTAEYTKFFMDKRICTELMLLSGKCFVSWLAVTLLIDCHIYFDPTTNNMFTASHVRVATEV